ncbi:MAG TPA: DUF507 family protein [Polyangiaceae bacterium]|jgi:hypothetical protein|nr:DUF507 family protein [Polyangiaceae bacterium]
MRLHSAKVPEISHLMVHALTSAGDIETESPKEVELDVQAVLNQFITDEQEVSDKAKDVLAQRGLPQTELGRIKKLLADERKIKLGDDAIDYLLDQLVEMLMHSANVDEIFAEDFELRRKLRDPLRKQVAVEQEMDAEVRKQIKHVKEGTAVWEVEYRRMMDDIKRRKGL